MLTQVGAPCPDHLVNTKRRPWSPSIRRGDEPLGLGGALRRALDSYEAWYGYYYEDTRRRDAPFPLDPSGPRSR